MEWVLCKTQTCLAVSCWALSPEAFFLLLAFCPEDIWEQGWTTASAGGVSLENLLQAEGNLSWFIFFIYFLRFEVREIRWWIIWKIIISCLFVAVVAHIENSVVCALEPQGDTVRHNLRASPPHWISSFSRGINNFWDVQFITPFVGNG